MKDYPVVRTSESYSAGFARGCVHVHSPYQWLNCTEKKEEGQIWHCFASWGLSDSVILWISGVNGHAVTSSSGENQLDSHHLRALTPHWSTLVARHSQDVAGAALDEVWL